MMTGSQAKGMANLAVWVVQKVMEVGLVLVRMVLVVVLVWGLLSSWSL